MADSGYFVTTLQRSVDLESVESKPAAQRPVVTDNQGSQMNISEFGPAR